MVFAVVEERPRLVERDECPLARREAAGVPAAVERGHRVGQLAVVGEPHARARRDPRAHRVEVVLVERVAPAPDRPARVLEQRGGVDFVRLARGGTRGLIVDRRIRRRLAARGHRPVERERPQRGAHRDRDVLHAVELVGRGRAGADARAFLLRAERPAADAGADVVGLHLPPGRAAEQQAAGRGEGTARAEERARHLLPPHHAARRAVDGRENPDRVGQGEVEPGGVPHERVGEAPGATDVRVPLRVDVARVGREGHRGDPHQRDRHARGHHRLLVDRRRRVAAAIELERRRHAVAPV